jgi:uncharacterized protein YjiS (DUF1127 family)
MEIAVRRVAGKSASDWLHDTRINGRREARGAPALRVVAGIFRMISRWIDRSNQRNALADLDDHLLRDIGKSGEDARREASKPFWKS